MYQKKENYGRTRTVQSEQKRTTVDIVVNNIKKLLIERKLKPGDRLPNEVEISEAMNVSRGSVREALRILTAFGLVESRVGTGTYICQKPGRTLADSLLFSFFVNNPNIGKLYEFRRLIEIDILESVLVIMMKMKKNAGCWRKM